MRKIILSLLVSAVLLYACSKNDKAGILAPDVKLSVTADAITKQVNTTQKFEAATNNTQGFSHEWKLDGKVVSTVYFYDFTALQAGTYLLQYTASNSAGTYTHRYTIDVPVPVVDITPGSSKFISKVFEYLPAPGQFVNELSGTPEQAQKLIGNTDNLVSLGSFGGYIIFGFDHSVKNNTGYDFGIYGNPSGAPYHFSEPGIVMVSQDINGNGLPDDPWYELAGSEYDKATTTKNYEVTYTNPKAFANVPWKDNKGNTGVVEVNNFHKHNFYPEFAKNQETLTFKGTLLPPSLGKAGSIVISTPFDWGYSDSYSPGDDYNTKRYNSFDIDWAVDQTGKKVKLSTIDFVKVYTGQLANTGSVGEISTEVKGAIDLGIK